MTTAPHRRNLLAAAAALAVMGACSPSGGDGAGPNDAAEVANARFAGSEAAAAIAAGPVLVIGGNEADPEAQFDAVGSAAFVGDGRIAVANVGSGEVFVFDSVGRRLLTVGGVGGGPGEFTAFSATAVASAGDTIPVAAFDPFGRKIAYFAITGELLGELLPPAPMELRGGFSAPVVDPSGTMFFIHFPLDPNEQTNDAGQPVGAAVRFNVRTGSLHRFFEVPIPEPVSVDFGPMRTFGGPPIAGPALVQPIFAASNEITGGGRPFRIAIGTQSDSIISIFDENGVLDRRIGLPARERTPTRQQMELAREEYFASPAGRGTAFRFMRGADGIRDRMPIAERTPIFRALRITDTGDLWVERYPLPGDPAVLWWVFAPDGEYRGEAWVPHGVWVLAIGATHYLARASDELDVQRVEMWPVVVR